MNATFPPIQEILESVRKDYGGVGDHQAIVLYIRDNGLECVDPEEDGYSTAALRAKAEELGFADLNLATNTAQLRSWKKGQPKPLAKAESLKVLSEPLTVMAEVLAVHAPFKIDKDRIRAQLNIKDLVKDIPQEKVSLMAKLDDDFKKALKFADINPEVVS